MTKSQLKKVGILFERRGTRSWLRVADEKEAIKICMPEILELYRSGIKTKKAVRVYSDNSLPYSLNIPPSEDN